MKPSLFYKIINDQLNINSWINQLQYIHTMGYYCNKKEQTNDTCKKMVNLKKKKMVNLKCKNVNLK